MTFAAKKFALLAALACALAAGAVETAYAQVASAPPPPNRLIKSNLWMIFTTDTPGFKKPPGLFPSHLAHLADLEKSGVLFAAGPVFSASGAHEYGIIVIRAASAAEAKRIADSDPIHASGAATYVLHQWSVNEGKVTYSINLSDSKASFR